jgi:hypothetical protein
MDQDTFREGGTTAAGRSAAPAARGWSFVADGPPLWLVAPVFVLLLVGWLAPGWAALGLTAFALFVVAVATVTVRGLLADLRRWAGGPAVDVEGVRARLDAAHARRIERDRWR